jgi:hypothetical protein
MTIARAVTILLVAWAIAHVAAVLTDLLLALHASPLALWLATIDVCAAGWLVVLSTEPHR